MKPAYQTLNWLEVRWLARELADWPESEVRERQQIVAQADNANRALYWRTHSDLVAARADFRATHRRDTSLPSDLRKSVEAPPDYEAMFKHLIKRRRDYLARQEREQQQRTYEARHSVDAFKIRMREGRISAQQRRERTIREMINEKANEQGITLTERATDVRLAELLNQLTRLEVVDVEVVPQGELNLV